MPSYDTRFWVAVAIVIGIGGYAWFDIVLLVRYGPAATVSSVIRGWGDDFPALPFILAFAFGMFIYHIAYR
jgi:hypothetical protein